jgi:hypothetical protein
LLLYPNAKESVIGLFDSFQGNHQRNGGGEGHHKQHRQKYLYPKTHRNHLLGGFKQCPKPPVKTQEGGKRIQLKANSLLPKKDARKIPGACLSQGVVETN